MKNIDADYYGYRDEDDGVIVPLEAELEQKRNNNNMFVYNHLSINTISSLLINY